MVAIILIINVEFSQNVHVCTVYTLETFGSLSNLYVMLQRLMLLGFNRTWKCFLNLLQTKFIIFQKVLHILYNTITADKLFYSLCTLYIGSYRCTKNVKLKENGFRNRIHKSTIGKSNLRGYFYVRAKILWILYLRRCCKYIREMCVYSTTNVYKEKFQDFFYCYCYTTALI